MDTGTWWYLGQAVILGLVQGLTEFIPVSSSGHLIIARELLGLKDSGLFFDAVLHLATFLAILIYFRRDWWQMLTISLAKKESKTPLVADRRLLGLILMATIPGLLVGYFSHSWIENNFRSSLSVAILMLAIGLVYLAFEYWSKLPKMSRTLNNFDAFGIGLAQAIAVIPGISRSGMTMLGGRYVGLNREAAAKFSFMLAAPIVAAAGGYGLLQAIKDNLIRQDYLFWLVAFGISLISGLLVIGWLLRFFQKHSLNWFAYYLLVVGTGIIVYSFFS